MLWLKPRHQGIVWQETNAYCDRRVVCHDQVLRRRNGLGRGVLRQRIRRRPASQGRREGPALRRSTG